MSYVRGFTLVELMVALAITAIVLLETVAFGVAWIQNAKISDAQSTLSEAVARAKSMSLRNDFSVVDTSHVMSICVDTENVLTLHKKNIEAADSCTGDVVWQQNFSEDVVVSDGSERMACMCFDNRAHRTLTNCSACSITNTVSISVGNNYEFTGIL